MTGNPAGRPAPERAQRRCEGFVPNQVARRGERVNQTMTATNSKVRSVMSDTGSFNEDTGKEEEKGTDADKHGWAPDVGKQGREKSHKAPENAYQGGGKPAGPAGGTESSS